MVQRGKELTLLREGEGRKPGRESARGSVFVPKKRKIVLRKGGEGEKIEPRTPKGREEGGRREIAM